MAASAGILTSACTKRTSVPLPATPARPLRLPRVLCDESRVIRTVAGLRPYRPSGYVVRTEQRGVKTIIHNYGHGGAGITMSWGTAQLALEQAARTPHRNFAVLGCGVIGLSTALLLQRNGMQATIYAKSLPPDTTSNIAGGFWSPVTLFEGGKQSAEFAAHYERAALFSMRQFQTLTGSEYAVRWLPFYDLSNHPPGPSTPNPFPKIRTLFAGGRTLSDAENPFPVQRTTERFSLLIEPATYLRALIRDFRIAGGRIVVRDFRTLDDVLALDEPAIINCTGLGAKALFGDPELTPIKGQLTFLLPQPEIQYMTLGPDDLYMFPRTDGILLGGTHEEGNWDLTPDPEHTKRIIQGHAALYSAMR